ncbi:plastid division protein PDV1-like [Amaranthus tricolor]|uniref:plastid division protein PDV1-like n=1 Tax=Amaranthus tricolor TaxID=29722 RepID=UPI0025830D30|nr:plastid division protein PDV1-like [Amaranthus tricolor]
MKWDVEMEEIEAVLDKISDLHDKLSDAIHSISRTHFLSSTKSFKNNNNSADHNNFKSNECHFFDHDFKTNNENVNGFVFFKDSAIAEAKSLNSIRSALEHLEQQLGFLDTVQIQQRAERDAAVARLEQSRIILAVRLAEHHGKRYKVIDEAMDFVGSVRDATSCFMGPENSSNPPASAPFDHSMQQKGVDANIFVKLLFAGLDSAKRTLQLDKLSGVLGNTALFALSMLAMLHLQQATYKDNIGLKHYRTVKKSSLRDSSSSAQSSPLDVRFARG